MIIITNAVVQNMKIVIFFIFCYRYRRSDQWNQFNTQWYNKPVPVAERFKSQVCGRSPVDIVGLNTVLRVVR